jgi:hypothetical protein
MGCTKCKEKNKVNVDLNKTIERTQSGVVIFVVIWSLFTIYGLFSFVKLFL